MSEQSKGTFERSKHQQHDCLLPRSIAERQEWVEAISTAQEEYIQKKMTFAAAADQLLEAGRGGELGDTAPVWVPDARVAMCQLCCAEFSLMVRRHHCRACGKVVCGACSGSKAPVKYKQFEAVRVCSQCCEELLKKYRVQHPELIPKFKGRPGAVNRSASRKTSAPRYATPAADSATAQMSGYLKMRRHGRWMEGWWVLQDHVLYRYVAMKDPRAVEAIPVLGWTLESPDKQVTSYLSTPIFLYITFQETGASSPGLVFQLTHPAAAMENMMFSAENENFVEKWKWWIEDAIKLT